MKNQKGFVTWITIALIAVIALGLVGVGWYYLSNRETANSSTSSATNNVDTSTNENSNLNSSVAPTTNINVTNTDTGSNINISSNTNTSQLELNTEGATIDLEEGADKADIGDFNEPHELIDEDEDGLYAELETMWQTSDTSTDSDNDGYSDLEEIQKCYSPVGPGEMDGTYFTNSYCPTWWEFALDYAEADTNTYNTYLSLIPSFCGYWESFADLYISVAQQGGNRFSESLDEDGDEFQKSCTAMINDPELSVFIDYVIEINVEPEGYPEIFCYFMSNTVTSMCGEDVEFKW